MSEGVKSKFSGYIMAVAAGIILFMHLGALGTIGVFIRPIAEGNGFSISSTMLIITFATAGGAGLGLIAPPIIRKLKPRGSLIIASFACGLHYWGFAFSHTIWMYWFWGFVASVPLVFGSNAVIGSVVGSWFIERRASVLGFVFGAASLGGAAWQFASGLLITNFGFRTAYMIMGSVLAGVALLVNLVILRMPDQIGQKPLGWEEAEKQKVAAASANIASGKVSADGLTVSEARKTASYWMIFIGLFLSVLATGGGRSNMNLFLTGKGLSVVQASSYTSLTSLLASAATVMGGFISQKMGNRVYMVYTHAAFITGCIVLLLNVNIAAPIMMITVIMYALSAPISTAMSPTVNSQAFGNKDYANILTSMAPALLMGSAIYPIVVSTILGMGFAIETIYMVFATSNLCGLILLTLGLTSSPYVKMKKAMAK